MEGSRESSETATEDGDVWPRHCWRQSEAFIQASDVFVLYEPKSWRKHETMRIRDGRRGKGGGPDEASATG